MKKINKTLIITVFFLTTVFEPDLLADLRIISPIKNSAATPIFTADSDQKAKFTEGPFLNFNPFEAAAHVVDLIGDGREEVLTWGNNKITLFYNSGNTKVTRKWGDADYMQIKKLFCPLYNPR